MPLPPSSKSADAAKPAEGGVSYQHKAGEVVTIDDVTYTLKSPAAAWEMEDQAGNVLYLTEQHMAQEQEAGGEEEPDEEGGDTDLSKVDLKSMAPNKKGILKAKLKKEAGL